jgi:hypothetical protein
MGSGHETLKVTQRESEPDGRFSTRARDDTRLARNSAPYFESLLQ